MDIITRLLGSGLNFNFLNIFGDAELLMVRSSLFRSVMIEGKIQTVFQENVFYTTKSPSYKRNLHV